MTPARLCLVRHGETDWNRQGILQGWTDVPLNARGRAQARVLAEAWRSGDFAAVWASPLRRAHETAHIAAALLGLPPPACHAGLRERCFGVIQGIPKAEIGEANPVLLQQILRRNPAIVFEEGEAYDTFAERVLGALMEIGDRHPGERVLVVTHGWTLDVAVRHAAGLPTRAILDRKRRNGENLWVAADAAGVYAIP